MKMVLQLQLMHFIGIYLRRYQCLLHHQKKTMIRTLCNGSLFKLQTGAVSLVVVCKLHRAAYGVLIASIFVFFLPFHFIYIILVKQFILSLVIGVPFYSYSCTCLIVRRKEKEKRLIYQCRFVTSFAIVSGFFCLLCV